MDRLIPFIGDFCRFQRATTWLTIGVYSTALLLLGPGLPDLFRLGGLATKLRSTRDRSATLRLAATVVVVVPWCAFTAWAAARWWGDFGAAVVLPTRIVIGAADGWPRLEIFVGGLTVLLMYPRPASVMLRNIAAGSLAVAGVAFTALSLYPWALITDQCGPF